LGLVCLNRRSDFRLKVSVVNGREEWRRKIGDFVFCFLRKGEDSRRGYPKLVTAAGGVRHRWVDPSNTEDPAKSLRTIAHSVRLQGFALVSYRFLTQHGW
jgi:hypothetical protein